MSYIPNVGGLKSKEVEIDFGSQSINRMTFHIVDSDVTTKSLPVFTKSLKQPSNGRPVEEIAAETLNFGAVSNNGSIDVTITPIVGNVSGKFIINYTV